MEKCTLRDECAFYQDAMRKMPLGSDYLKKIYCDRAPSKCERLRLSNEVAVGDPSNEITPLGRNFAP